MTTNEDIRNIQINVRESFTKSPENALNTSKSYAEVTNALVCTYSEGSRKTIMDMPTIAGGNDEGPTPGFHARISYFRLCSNWYKTRGYISSDQYVSPSKSSWKWILMIQLCLGLVKILQHR